MYKSKTPTWVCCQGRLQHDGNACVKSAAAAQGCWTEEAEERRDIKRQQVREIKERENQEIQSQVDLRPCVPDDEDSSLSCSVRAVIPRWHQHAVLCCPTRSVSVSYIPQPRKSKLKSKKAGLVQCQLLNTNIHTNTSKARQGSNYTLYTLGGGADMLMYW